MYIICKIVNKYKSFFFYLSRISSKSLPRYLSNKRIQYYNNLLVLFIILLQTLKAHLVFFYGFLHFIEMKYV